MPCSASNFSKRAFQVVPLSQGVLSCCVLIAPNNQNAPGLCHIWGRLRLLRAVPSVFHQPLGVINWCLHSPQLWPLNHERTEHFPEFCCSFIALTSLEWGRRGLKSLVPDQVALPAYELWQEGRAPLTHPCPRDCLRIPGAERSIGVRRREGEMH